MMAAHDEFANKQNNPCFIGLGSVGASQPSHFDIGHNVSPLCVAAELGYIYWLPFGHTGILGDIAPHVLGLYRYGHPPYRTTQYTD